MPQAAIAQSPSDQEAIPSPRRSPAGRLLAIDTARLSLRSDYGDDPGVLRVAIMIRLGLREVGWIQFSKWDGTDDEVELGFFLDPSYRGRGLMQEAARAVLPRALRILDARLLSAIVPADAPAAERVVRALGLLPARRRGSNSRFEKDLCGLI